MNHAADEYDDARPGLGDEFLATVETAFNGIVRIRSVLPVGDSSHLAG